MADLSELKTFDETIIFCNSFGDDVIPFEPRSKTTLDGIISKLGVTDDNHKFWVNAQRSSTPSTNDK